MIYNLLKRTIQKGTFIGTPESMQEKLDVYFFVERITEEQYKELTDLLNL